MSTADALLPGFATGAPKLSKHAVHSLGVRAVAGRATVHPWRREPVAGSSPRAAQWPVRSGTAYGMVVPPGADSTTIPRATQRPITCPLPSARDQCSPSRQSPDDLELRVRRHGRRKRCVSDRPVTRDGPYSARRTVDDQRCPPAGVPVQGRRALGARQRDAVQVLGPCGLEGDREQKTAAPVGECVGREAEREQAAPLRIATLKLVGTGRLREFSRASCANAGSSRRSPSWTPPHSRRVSCAAARSAKRAGADARSSRWLRALVKL